MRMRKFATYNSEAEAHEDMRRQRRRDYTVGYSEFWGGWVCWYTA